MKQRPAVLMILGLLGLAFMVLPVLAMLMDTPWQAFASILTSPTTRAALMLSLLVSLIATAICLVVGVPLAWLLAKELLPWTRLWRAFVLVPLLLPPVVSGVALLSAFGRRGLVGAPIYSLLGMQLPFTTAAVVLASAFVALPFLVITMEGAFRSVDHTIEEAATVDGAPARTVFWRVTLPMLGPSLLAGVLLCWARAIGEFGATITFAGNIEGVTQTMPLAVYTALETDRDSAVALSLVLLVIGVAIIVAMRGRYLPRINPGR